MLSYWPHQLPIGFSKGFLLLNILSHGLAISTTLILLHLRADDWQALPPAYLILFSLAILLFIALLFASALNNYWRASADSRYHLQLLSSGQLIIKTETHIQPKFLLQVFNKLRLGKSIASFLWQCHPDALDEGVRCNTSHIVVQGFYVSVDCYYLLEQEERVARLQLALCVDQLTAEDWRRLRIWALHFAGERNGLVLKDIEN